ncbi:MAG: hypothetical protein MSA07_03365 [Mucispirillum sp.]|nr:hypothetical protein [Mucispirillum sp.]
MRKLVLTAAVVLCALTVYAAEKEDLFGDYKIYSKYVEKTIYSTKKDVFSEINNLKKLMIDNKKESVTLKLTDIHNKIMQLDNFIKQYSDKMKTSNMKESLTYPVYELSFYEKVIKETADYYYKKGSITKKEIEAVEEKYKDEKSAVNKKAETLRHDFLKAVFE